MMPPRVDDPKVIDAFFSHPAAVSGTAPAETDDVEPAQDQKVSMATLVSLSHNKLDYEPEMPTRTTVQKELMRTLGKPSSSSEDYHERVIANFKANFDVLKRVNNVGGLSKAKRDRDESSNVQEPSSAVMAVSEHGESTLISDCNQSLSHKSTASPLASPAQPQVLSAASSPAALDHGVPLLEDPPSSIALVSSDGPASDTVVEADTLEEATSVLASKIREKTVVIPKTELMPEDREHAAVFNSWGLPAARDRRVSRIRTVVLSHLPINSDYALVQSLIHGGAIEKMSINFSGTAAYITFTGSEACDQYFDRYPNGISFKLRGKSHNVFVDKGSDVDVISGMLEGYLGAGASRVVRATGADEDWSMRALRKLAEGDKAQRKVESIFDSYRNELRTVVFRFVGIADAVAFKASLQRDPEWRDVDFQFMVDPCEVAEGIHFD